MANTDINLIVKVKDAASGPVGRIRKSLGQLGKTSLKGITSGLANLAKLAAGLAIGGLAALGIGLAYAAKQAIAEEVGIKRLNTTLEANQRLYKTNAEVRRGVNKIIDQQIARAEGLAFADDAVRDSLNALIPRTKSVGQALNLQNIAMDLARAKGMDLQTATLLVGKVYSGNVGILARYGIAVAKGATATEALAQIQKASAGQAEAYGKTTQGAFEAFQVAIGNVVEDVGAHLLPVLTTIALFLRSQVIPAIRQFVGNVEAWVKANQPLIAQVRAFVETVLRSLVSFVMGSVVPAIRNIAAIVLKVAPVILDFARRVWEGGLGKAVQLVIRIVGAVIARLAQFIAWITSNKKAMQVLGTVADIIGGAFGFVADAISTVIGWIGSIVGKITSNRKAMAVLGTVANAIGSAFITVWEAIQNVVNWIGSIARKISENKPLMRAFGIAARAIGSAFRAIGSAIGTAIERLGQFIARMREFLTIRRDIGHDPIGDIIFGGARQRGGPVAARKAYLVGERGPELFVPKTSGSIIAAPRPAAATAGGTVQVNVTFASLWPPSAAQREEIERVMGPIIRRAAGVSRSGVA